MYGQLGAKVKLGGGQHSVSQQTAIGIEVGLWKHSGRILMEICWDTAERLEEFWKDSGRILD